MKSSFLELQNRIEKMSNELVIYNREQVAIASSGPIHILLQILIPPLSELNFLLTIQVLNPRKTNSLPKRKNNRNYFLDFLMSMCTRCIEWWHSFLLSIKE